MTYMRTYVCMCICVYVHVHVPTYINILAADFWLNPVSFVINSYVQQLHIDNVANLVLL